MELNEYFLYGRISEEHKAFLNNVLNLGFDFVEGTARENKVLKYISNKELREVLSSDFPENGLKLNDLFEILKEKIARYSISQSDPRYLAFPDTGNSVAAIAADILSTFLNQNMIAVDRSAPIGVFVEAQLIQWLRQLIGYSYRDIDNLTQLDQVGGMWTSGGNMSNHIAVLAALNHKFPEVRVKGLTSLKKRPTIILAQGLEHFSFMGAAQTLGLGEEGIIWTRSNDDYTTDVKSVEEAILNNKEDSEPFMVIAVAGNCRTTSIDEIHKLRELCDKYGLWFHVDACHGGSLLFSEKLRTNLRGIELSDSVSLDPHKGLFVTYASSYVIFKDPKIQAMFSRYPEKASDPSCFDMGLITPFYGSRGFNSLKLWMLIKHMGRKGIEEAVENREKTYKNLVGLMDSLNMFVFLNDPTFYRSAFVLYPDSVREVVNNNSIVIDKTWLRKFISRYSSDFCEFLYKSGEVTFDLFSLQDLGDRLELGRSEKYQVLAVSVGHPYINDSITDTIIDYLKNSGSQFAEKMLEELNEYLFNEDFIPIIKEKVVLNGPASW